MIRVLVYDDNHARLDSLRELLNLTQQLSCVGVRENCLHVLEDIEELKPQMILMDIEMPGRNGIVAVSMARAKYPDILYVMQTNHDDDERIFQALKAGAVGYILKSATLMEILNALDTVAKGGAIMSPSVSLKVMKHFNQRASEVQTKYLLTAKEQEVLRSLADGLSYKMIAKQHDISVNTVSNHVKSIYRKLHVHSLAEAMALINRVNPLY